MEKKIRNLEQVGWVDRNGEANELNGWICWQFPSMPNNSKLKRKTFSGVKILPEAIATKRLQEVTEK